MLGAVVNRSAQTWVKPQPHASVESSRGAPSAPLLHRLPFANPTSYSIADLAKLCPQPRRAATSCSAKGARDTPTAGSDAKSVGASKGPGTEPQSVKAGPSSRGDPAAAKRSPGSQEEASAASQRSLDEDEDDDDDGFLEFGEGETGEENEEGEDEGAAWEGEDGGEDEDGEDGDDYAASFLEPDDAPREVVTGGTAWGEVVLQAAREVLAQPALQGLELYLFRALPSSRKVDIRLDKLDDLYGSPSIDDIERFQRGLFAALDRELGPEAAGDISFEVSSPGAERSVRVPDELPRFGELPLKVEYRGPDGREASSVLVLAELDEQASTSVWRLANVRANAPVKGRALSKKQLSTRITIPLRDIVRVRIHVDF